MTGLIAWTLVVLAGTWLVGARPARRPAAVPIPVPVRHQRRR